MICYRNGRVARVYRGIAYVLIGAMVWLQPGLVWALEYPRGDTNGDGAINQNDVGPLRDLVMERTNNFKAFTQGDFNQDGVIDVSDALAIENYNGDFDGDGISDTVEAAIDPVRVFDVERNPSTGPSEIPDTLKLDSLGTGYADSVARLRVDGQAVLPGGTLTDSDGDGIPNEGVQSEEDGWSIPAHPPYHNGGPFITDSLMVDTDRDGFTDYEEMQHETNPLDPDTDGDGYLDGTDPDPLNPSKAGGGKGRPDLTPSQIAENKKFQQEQELKRMEKGDTGQSGRGLGFQGPDAVGSSFESVQSDQFTGAFSYSLPIKVPPGRNGMQPNLALAYRSTNSHSWLGQGWDLNPGRIERSTKNGPPKYNDASNPPASDNDPFTPLDNPDVFLYTTAAGGSQLVFTNTEVIGGLTCGIYHGEVDSGSFVRFIHHPDPALVNAGGGWWEAWMKDGRKAYFGGKGTFNKDSCLYDPDHFNDGTGLFSAGWGVFHWGLEREEDVSGNAIVYQYQHPAGTKNMFLNHVLYNYVNSVPKVGLTFTTTARAGHEGWASYRESYRAKFKMVSDQFLTQITVFVTARQPYERVRQYVLQYANLDVAKGRTISCLKNTQEFGETDASYFPAVSFGYSECNTGWEDMSDYVPVEPICFIEGAQYGVRIYDYDGDALPDFSRYTMWYPSGNTTVRAWTNTGSGWSPALGKWYPPSPFDKTDDSYVNPAFSYSYGALTADYNGDGLVDIAWSAYGPGGAWDWRQVALNRSDDPAYSSSIWEFHNAPDACPYHLPTQVGHHAASVSYGASVAELNGDGLPDLVKSYDGCFGLQRFAFLNNAGTGWAGSGSYGPPVGTQYFWDANNCAWDGGAAMDLNGDGLSDMFWSSIHDGSWYTRSVAMNVGTGWEFHNNDGHPFLPPGPFVLREWHWDYGTRFLDTNGDGLVDIVNAYDQDSTTVWAIALNSGNGWIGGPTSHVPCSFKWRNSSSGLQLTYGDSFADIDGDGLTDVVLSALWYNNNWATKRCIRNTGKIPSLLIHIDNGIGGTVDVEYTPSTKGWMKLYEPETGLLEVTDRIPYVLQTVSKIKRTGQWPDDAGSPQQQSYTTLYRYAGGKHLDREFRGFGKVKQIDAETGNFTITEFLQDFAQKGQIKTVRSYVGDRRDYRTDGTINGPLRSPKQESVPAHTPRLASETYNRYRVVIHAEDNLHLKTYTDTHTKLGLTDFPKGMTLVTPACSITKTYEYAGNYAQGPTSVPSIVTAQETFYDGRGNLTQTSNYGQVSTVIPGAMLQDLENPRVDVTFTDKTTGDPDGQVSQMTQYERRGDWMDVPVLVNAAGYYTSNRDTGERAVDDVKILQAQTIEYDPVTYLPIRVINSLDTGSDPVTSYQYDSYGNVVRTTDPRGNRTDIAYETTYCTFPATRTNALGHVESFVFDPGFGKLLQYTDTNWRTRRAEYDGIGRILSRKDSAGNETLSYEYGFWTDLGGGLFAPNRVKTTTHTPTGDVWSEDRYDGLGRKYEALTVGQNGPANPIRALTIFNDRNTPWKTTLPHWRSEAGSEHWQYSILENDSPTSPNGVWAQMGLDRPVKTRQELNATEVAEALVTYETPLMQKTTDPAGHERRVVSDGFGNRIGVWEPNAAGGVGIYPSFDGQLTEYGYDGVGRLEFVRRHVYLNQDQDADPITNIWYDTLGRKTQMDDPDRGLSTYAYDANGNLIRSKDARGIEIVREYDTLNRMTRLICPDASSGNFQIQTYTYDMGSGTNLVGRLARAQSPGCTVNYSYDDEGRTTLAQRIIDGTSYSVSGAFDYAGRPTSLTYPDGMQLVYTYDAVTQTLDRIAESGSGQVYLANKTASKFGTPALVALGNGVDETRSFDYAGRVTDRTAQQGATTLSNLHYTFAPDSNISRITAVRLFYDKTAVSQSVTNN